MVVKKVYTPWFVLPAFVLYIAFFVIPCLGGILFSFTNWNSFSIDIRFIGLENFRSIFSASNSYAKAIWNTLVFTAFSSFGKVFFGLLLALLLNQRFRGQELLRGIFFMPFAISPLIIGIVFVSVLAPAGIFNTILRGVGLGGLARSWLSDVNTALGAIIVVEIWKSVGLNLVVFLAGLQGINKEYYEAARIDGAGAWNCFYYITLHFLMPSVTINLILNLIHGLKVFDIVMALTNGGPGNTTQVMNTLVFKTYSMGAYGLSSSLSTVLFCITMGIAALAYRIIAPKED